MAKHRKHLLEEGGALLRPARSYFQRLIPLLLIAIAVSAIKMRMPVRTSAAGSSANDITAVLVDVSRIRHVSNGDTWDYIWADDDTIYSFNCNGRGYGKDRRNVWWPAGSNQKVANGCMMYTEPRSEAQNG